MSSKRSHCSRRHAHSFSLSRRLRVEPLEERRLLTVLTVNSTGDDDALTPSDGTGYTDEFGTITLRSAIEALDANSAVTEIDFNITSTPETIYPNSSALPPITRDGVTINGLNQATSNRIGLDGTDAGTGASGLVINASSCTIEGLQIENFASGCGIEIASHTSGGTLIPAHQNTVENNELWGNNIGVAIIGAGTPGTQDQVIVDLNARTSDLISNVNDATGNQIINNRILGNSADGVLISHASQNTVRGNTIGNTTDGPGVEIFGTGNAVVDNIDPFGTNPNERITITNDAVGNQILGNSIGIDPDNANQSNAGGGVLIDGGSLNLVGGAGPGEGNIIAYNGGDGVHIGGETDGPPTVEGISNTASAPLASPAVDTQTGLAGTFGLDGNLLAAVSGLSARLLQASNLNAGNLSEGNNQPLVNTANALTADAPIQVTSSGRVPILNQIQGNFIGTNIAGTDTAPNTGSGILVEAAARVTIIGGDTAAKGNLIGGNAQNGIEVDGDPLDAHTPDDPAFENNTPIFEDTPTLIAGNSIGVHTLTTGAESYTYPLGNGHDGILIHNSQAYILQNTISANGTADDAATGNGVQISGAPRFAFSDGSFDNNVCSELLQNKIGTDASGMSITTPLGEETVSLGNLGDGVLLDQGAHDNFVGPFAATTTPGNRNVISGNHGYGVHITGVGEFRVHDVPGSGSNDPYPWPSVGYYAQPYGGVHNWVIGNYIGTDAAGTTAAGNALGGVKLDHAAAYNLVGMPGEAPHTWAGLGNLISGNGGPGVTVEGDVGTQVNTLTPGSVTSGDTFTVTIDGHTVSYTATASTVANVCVGLQAQLAASTLSEFQQITWTTDGASITGTANSVGTPFTQTSSATGGSELETTSSIPIAWSNVNNIGANIIGLNKDGNAAIPNQGAGILITGYANQTNIGGDTGVGPAEGGNYISGNHGPGVKIVDVYDGTGYGTDAGSEFFLPGDTNVFGNPIPSDQWGLPKVDLTGVSVDENRNNISANFIGLGKAGQPIPNTDDDTDEENPVPGDGILIINSSDTLIGGEPSLLDRNIISANTGNGIHITGAKSFLNQVHNTYIGTDASGTSITAEVDEEPVALGNQLDGILIDDGASYNNINGISIGKTFWEYAVGIAQQTKDAIPDAVKWADSHYDNATDGTVISGNAQNGVEISGSGTTNNIIGGNVFIGTDAAGQAALGNGDSSYSGVLIAAGAQSNSILAGVRPLYVQNIDPADPSQYVTWGGTVLRNVISGNVGAGVTIEGSGTAGNVIEGALIGTTADGQSPLGNGGDGILIADGATGNTIASTALKNAQGGGPVFRQGEFHVQETTGAQFWSSQNPANTAGFSGQMGFPAADVDWMMGGTLKSGAEAVTRSAPGYGGSAGGAMEAVVNPGGVRIDWFHMPDRK